jgi:putative MATE family efflux protein
MQKHQGLGKTLDSDRIGWLLLKLSIPAFFGMFVQTLYNVVNTIFVGHYVGPLGIAGLSVVFPLQMFAMGLGMMVGMGGASLISRQLGNRDVAGAERTVGNGVTLGIVLYVLVCIIVLPFMDFWLKLIGASEAVLPYAKDYLFIIITGSIFSIYAVMLLTFARAEGNARVGMIAMIIGAALSIILSAVFIIPLNMGVTGAGLATIIAQIVSTAYLLSYYLTGSSYLKMRISNFVPDFKILKAMFSIGIAAFSQTVASSLSAVLVINTVVSYGGDYALSAFGIIQRIMMFAIMPAMVMGQGAQPILGFNYGARRFHYAMKAMRLALFAATILSTGVFLLVYFIPETLIKIFSTDPVLITTGAYASKLMFLSMPLMGLIMVSTQIFQALGKVTQAFITAIMRPLVFMIPLIFILPRFWQIEGVWLAFPFSDALASVLMVILLIPIFRQFNKAAKGETQEMQTPDTPHGILEPVNNPAVD